MAKLMEIVVGLDGSPASWRAFWLTLGVAEREKAFVHVCFVFHVPGITAIGSLVEAAPGLAMEEDGGELGRQVTEELQAADVHGKFICLEGDVAYELEALAESCRADLVVVGRSRHPALHLGGVPRRLLAMGRRPVLVVP
jgi:nucleotide-binding universal stress UspA family protein